MFYNKDTITAISTPIGQGAVSIIRISGKESVLIVDKIFSKDVTNLKSHTVHFGKILDSKKNVIDTALLVIMLSPNSYTGEDIIELQCHGGNLITKKVLQRVIEAGARAANPGEFTLRAFLNNKLDLSQAESVQELISAKNNLSLTAAKNNLEGLLSKQIKYFQKDLTQTAAILEAWVDFPEEDLEFASKEEIIQQINTSIQKMKKLSSSYEDGKIIKDGISLCILGSPNVGKSSLMNALLKKDRAIVTEIAGTTRDLIEEDFKLNNLHFNLIDTAGIRKTDEKIEKEGIKRSEAAMKKADINLLVLDSTRELNNTDKDLLKKIKTENTIVIINKIDVKKPRFSIDDKNIVEISAKNLINLDKLQLAIENLIFKNILKSKEELVLTNERHKNAIDQSIAYLQKVKNGLKKDLSCEFISFDMKSSLKELSKIIGTDITEDILTSIFSKFCIGK